MLDLQYLAVPDDDEPDELPVIEEECYAENTTVEIVILDAWLGEDACSSTQAEQATAAA